MRHGASLILWSSSAFLLASCGGNTNISSAGASNPGYGPFDRNGNYIEAWADRPAKKHWWARSTPEPPAATKEIPAVASNTTKPPKPPRSTEVASLDRTYTPPKPAPRPVAYTPPPKPRPKPTPVKPKAPPPIRHTVVKGDTLYNISRRHNTSVTRIQRANGIKGTTIRLGKTLLIPRS